MLVHILFSFYYILTLVLLLNIPAMIVFRKIFVKELIQYRKNIFYHLCFFAALSIVLFYGYPDKVQLFISTFLKAKEALFIPFLGFQLVLILDLLDRKKDLR